MCVFSNVFGKVPQLSLKLGLVREPDKSVDKVDLTMRGDLSEGHEPHI